MREVTNNNDALVIEVDKSVTDYIQMLLYEVDGLEILYTHALQVGIDKEKCDEIQDKFLNRLKEYRVAKEELVDMYINPLVKSGDKYSWELDFSRRMIYVYGKECS